MKPLEGIKIIDFTQAHAGSLGTMLLADFGAEVIKVERPRVGDLARYWPPFKGDDSAYYAFLNRNKKSITVNARSEEGQAVLKELIKEADIVCENFKVGNMERLGLGYESLKEINPRLIYASVSGYGISGPLKDLPAYDLMLQAMSGMMDMTGFKDGLPTKIGPAIGDHISGTYMANAVCLALLQRSLTGEGQRIDIGILDTLVSTLDDTFALASQGEAVTRNDNKEAGTYIGDTFQVSDGYVSLHLDSLASAKKLMSVLGMTEDQASADGFTKVLREKLLGYEKRDLEEQLLSAGIDCVFVRSIDEMLEEEIIKNGSQIITIEDATMGKLTMASNPIHLSNTPFEIRNTAPKLGEHTEEILKAAGYDDSQIADLKSNKAI